MTSTKPDETQAAFPWGKRGALRGKSKAAVLCCAFSNDDQTVYAGLYDGVLAAFDANALAARGEISLADQSSKTPVTCIGVRPTGKPQLIAGDTSGRLYRIDGKTLERLGEPIVEPDNEIYSCDWSADGTHFVTCGRDATIRIYAETSNELVRKYCFAPQYPANVSATRLFSVRFDPANSKTIYAGGWGNTIYRCDLDAPEASLHDHVEFFGAYITGDAVDVAGGVLMSASNRLDDVIQIWDQDSKKPTTVPWPVRFKFLPNCAKISRDGKFFACGGGGGQGLQAGFFVTEMSSNKAVVEVPVEKSIASCAFARQSALVAAGDVEGQVLLFENRFAKR